MSVTTMTAAIARRLASLWREVWTAAISALLHAIEIFDVDVGYGDHHDQHDVGERAGKPGLPLLEGHFVQSDGDHFRGRLAAHDERQIEALERLHGAEDEGNQRSEERRVGK